MASGDAVYFDAASGYVLLANGVFPKLVDDTVKAAYQRSLEIVSEI